MHLCLTAKIDQRYGIVGVCCMALTGLMVSHLLKEGDFDPAELSALSEMIARRVGETGGAKHE